MWRRLHIGSHATIKKETALRYKRYYIDTFSFFRTLGVRLHISYTNQKLFSKPRRKANQSNTFPHAAAWRTQSNHFFHAVAYGESNQKVLSNQIMFSTPRRGEVTSSSNEGSQSGHNYYYKRAREQSTAIQLNPPIASRVTKNIRSWCRNTVSHEVETHSMPNRSLRPMKYTTNV